MIPLLSATIRGEMVQYGLYLVDLDNGLCIGSGNNDHNEHSGFSYASIMKWKYTERYVLLI